MSSFIREIDEFQPVFFQLDYGDSGDTAAKVDELSSCILREKGVEIQDYLLDDCFACPDEIDFKRQMVTTMEWSESSSNGVEETDHGMSSRENFPTSESISVSQAAPEKEKISSRIDFFHAKKNKIWSLAERRLLKRFKEEGVSYRDIAEKIKCRSGADCFAEWTKLVRNDFWTKEERNCALSLLRRRIPSDESFKMVAEELKLKEISLTEKTAADCKMVFTSYHISPWTEEEDSMLKRLVSESLSWLEISKSVGRSSLSCRGRLSRLKLECPVADSSLKGSVMERRKKCGDWTKEEDEKLIAAVYKYSRARRVCWKEIVNLFGGIRTRLSCVRRWEKIRGGPPCNYRRCRSMGK